MYEFYTQINIITYKELLKGKTIYPIKGVSCNADNNFALNELSRVLKCDFFFGWKDLKDVEINKGINFEIFNEEKEYVLLKIFLDEEYIAETDYYNYADIVYLGVLQKKVTLEKII